MKTLFGLLALTYLLLTSGCASMVSGTTQQIAFDSNPNSADVLVDGNKVGVTPCIAVLPRSKLPPRVELKKDGYQTVQVPVMSRFNYWVIGNVLWGWFSTTGFAVDFTSHDATVEYDPNRYFTTLEPLKSPAGEAPKATEAKPPVVATSEQLPGKTARYLLVNYDALAADIARGHGEYLTALFELLGVAEEAKPAALSKLKKLYVEHAEPVAFARAVEAAFVVSSAAPPGQ